MGFPLCLRQIHLFRVFERMRVSPVATGDLGLCPKNLRAFEKARPKLSLTGAVRDVNMVPSGRELDFAKQKTEGARVTKDLVLFFQEIYTRATRRLLPSLRAS